MIEITAPEVISTWVEDGQAEDVSYQIRFAPPEVLDKKSEFERFDFILLDWKGVKMNGEPAPCTQENKLAFFIWDVDENDAAKYFFLHSNAQSMMPFIDVKKTLARLSRPSSGGSTSRVPTPNGAQSASPNATA